MSALYLHIPFCKTICYYCDFYFSLSLTNKKQMVDALCKEISERHSYLESNTLDTIYFGGGTPSVLSGTELSEIFDCIAKYFDISHCKEITIEVNPDDITADYITVLQNTPINRISIGIQSFKDDDLKIMNRRHSGSQAEESLDLLFSAGYTNVSADLMFALPQMTNERLSFSIDRLLQFPVTHISAYNLTIEQGTAFDKFVRTNKISVPNDDEAIEQYSYLTDTLRSHGFDRYEISNFAKNGYHSQHNTSYWEQKPYLGIGPSAHSYNGDTRQWNVSNNRKYLAAIEQGTSYYELEHLSTYDRYNEYVFTALRTQKGISVSAMKDMFDDSIFSYFLQEVKVFIQNEFIAETNGNLVLTESGVSIADKIASDLFIVAEA